MPRKGSLTRRNRARQTTIVDNRVVLYVRASTIDQVNSLEAQKSAAARFAAQNNIVISASAFVDSGVSAVKHGMRDRPQASEMFRYIRANGIRSVLILRVDRAFRSNLDFSQTLAWSRDEGFSFRFIDPDVDLATPMGELFVQIQVALAQLECDIRSTRVDEAYDSLRDNRLSRNGRRAPYGWNAMPCADGTTTRDGKEQYTHVPIAAEQAVLIHIHSRWESYRGKHGALTHIARELNELTIPAKMAGKEMKRDGVIFRCSGIWQAATVKSVLEHAVIATAQELPDPPDLTTAIATLQAAATSA